MNRPEPNPPSPPHSDETVTLPSLDATLEQLLIKSQVAEIADFARAMHLAYEQKMDVGSALVELRVVDVELLEMARELQELIDENIVDQASCIRALKDAHNDQGHHQAAAVELPGGSDRAEQGRFAPDLAARAVSLPDFFALCKVAEFDPDASEIAERCFNLVQARQISVEEAVFAYQFCHRQIKEKGDILINAAELLAFHSGIWALHDSLHGL